MKHNKKEANFEPKIYHIRPTEIIQPLEQLLSVCRGTNHNLKRAFITPKGVGLWEGLK